MNQIPYDKRVEVYKEALRKNGKLIQQVVAMEEMMECAKEISKTIRGKGDMDHLAEEVADATIMLEQIRMMHGINEAVCRKMDEKIRRLSNNLGVKE